MLQNIQAQHLIKISRLNQKLVCKKVFFPVNRIFVLFLSTIPTFPLPSFSPIPQATDLFTIPHFLFLSKITLPKDLPHLNFGISNYAICDKAWLGILLKKPLWLQQANNAYFSWKAFLRRKQKKPKNTVI